MDGGLFCGAGYPWRQGCPARCFAVIVLSDQDFFLTVQIIKNK